MNKETEIKLRVSPATLDALREHPLLKKRNKGGWQRVELFNQYYDTANRDLSAAKVALRIRRDGDQFIQTLKSRGQSVAGLSERNEWDWYLTSPELDLSKLDDSCWPASLATLDKSTLQPLFSTDFTRDKAEIAWGRGKAKVVIEAALDQGLVIAGEGQEAICELELELRQGEPAALLELACELAAELPLMPCDISKAERGYRLFDSGSYSISLGQPELQPQMSLDQAIAAIGWHLLSSSQRLAEQYRFNGHWRLLAEWVERLIELRALLASLGQAAPRTCSRELRQGLDELLKDWRPRLISGANDDELRRNAPQLFAAELDGPRWGLLSLQLANWLHNSSWMSARNAQGQRQGEAVLINWLNTYLRHEFSELNLRHYQQKPLRLLEQTPRLERLQVWLRTARHVLEQEDCNRLFGELAKLNEAVRQQADELALEYQVRAVQQLPVYKSFIA